VIVSYRNYLKELLITVSVDKVHMFSTYFYGALTKTKKGVDFEKDRSLTEAQRQYKRVERWTKNIDLFEKVRY
jgi:Ulp1 family protease